MRRYLLEERDKPGVGLSVNAREVHAPIAIHWHDYVEVELVTGGCGSQRLNGQEIVLKRGVLSVLRLSDFHELAADPEVRILNLAVEERLLSFGLMTRLLPCKVLQFELDEEETRTMEILLGLCLEEHGKTAPNTEYLRHLLDCILLRVLQLLPREIDASVEQTDPIQTALLYLQMHFRENPGLPELAKIAHYSDSHFCTTFHKRIGMTYTQYLNILKTEYAEKLLLSTDMKVTDISYESGFASHATFLRLFRRKTGVSPSEYRKTHVKA